MDVRKRTLGGQSLRAVALLAILALLAVACGGAVASPVATTASQPASASPAPSASEGPIVTPVPGQGGLTSDGRPLIRWFVGLGTGERPNQIGVEQAVVDAFNAEHDPRIRTTSPATRTSSCRSRSTATRSRTTRSRPRSPPATRRTSSARSASARLQSFGDQLLDLGRTSRAPASTCRRSPRTSSSVYNARRQADRHPDGRLSRRSSTTTRPCSTRPACPSRRTRSATSTTARTGTGRPSPSWPRS